jgi:hypothetical protein
MRSTVHYNLTSIYYPQSEGKFTTREISMPRFHYLLRVSGAEMARSIWMAKKLTRGMTYQWKAKDLVNAREDIWGG